MKTLKQLERLLTRKQYEDMSLSGWPCVLELIAAKLELKSKQYQQQAKYCEDSRDREYAAIKAEVIVEIQYAIREAIAEMLKPEP